MTARESTITLPGEVASIRTGRHFARDLMLQWDLEQLVDDVQLGVSELATNAVRHAGTDFVLTVRCDTAVTILVSDAEPDLHQPSSPQVDPTAVATTIERRVVPISVVQRQLSNPFHAPDFSVVPPKPRVY